MAIIFTYPTKVTPTLADTIVITDSESEDPEDRTKQISIASIKDTINVVDNLTAGSGISVSNPTGDITIGNTGILSLTAGNNVSLSGSNDNITISALADISAGTPFSDSVIPVINGSNELIDSPMQVSGDDLIMKRYIRHLGDNGALFGFNTDSEFLIYTESNDQESLRITPTGTAIKTNATNRFTTTAAGATELYYAGVKKFETTATGSTLTGNVGIGISIPDDKLHVVGNIRVASTSPIIKFDETDTTDENWALINSGGTMTIRTSDDTFSSYDTKVTIKQDGKVGIGETNPTSILQVVGLAEYADNTTAGAAGLTVGAFYRTGDFLKVVH